VALGYSDWIVVGISEIGILGEGCWGHPLEMGVLALVGTGGCTGSVITILIVVVRCDGFMDGYPPSFVAAAGSGMGEAVGSCLVLRMAMIRPVVELFGEGDAPVQGAIVVDLGPIRMVG